MSKRRMGPHRKVGRPKDEHGMYAWNLGVTRKSIMRLGGALKLERMSEDARQLLLAKLKRCGVRQ